MFASAAESALRILIVCTANRFRSPLAERIVQLDWSEFVVEVSSAGLLANSGAAAHDAASALASKHGLASLESHRARLLGPSLLRRADLVLTMEARQQRDVLRMMPAFTGRVMTLGCWRDVQIADPIVTPQVDCDGSFELMRRCLEDWRRHLEASGLLPRRAAPASSRIEEFHHV